MNVFDEDSSIHSSYSLLSFFSIPFSSTSPSNHILLTIHDLVYRLKGYGTFEDFTVLNSPAQAISIGTTDTSVISSVTVDNSAGDTDDLGHNTDGFDLSASDVTIKGCTVKNQDDW